MYCIVLYYIILYGIIVIRLFIIDDLLSWLMMVVDDIILATNTCYDKEVMKDGKSWRSIFTNQ